MQYSRRTDEEPRLDSLPSELFRGNNNSSSTLALARVGSQGVTVAALASSNGSGKGMIALRQVAGPSSEGYWGYGIGAAHGVELRSVADEDTKGKPETTGLASKANKKESTTTVKKSKNESKPNPTQTPTSTTKTMIQDMLHIATKADCPPTASSFELAASPPRSPSTW